MRARPEPVNAVFTWPWQPPSMQLPPGSAPADCSPDKGEEAALSLALLDSRRRWRGLLAMATDFAFETDGAGRFSFVWPTIVLGWPASFLLGQPARSVLPVLAEGFDPFGAAEPVRNRSAWVRGRDGGTRLLRFSVAPLESGQGLRGVAMDVTAEHQAADEAASWRRKREATDHVAAAQREELLVPRMIGAVLRSAGKALGAAGAAVVLGAVVRDQTGPVPPEVLALAVQAPAHGDRAHTSSGAALTVLTAPVPDRLGFGATLVFWRASNGDGWSAGDGDIAVSVADAVRIALEQDQLRLEMARMARTDPLTGLLNRRAFAEELKRRLLRVENKTGPGVLICLDLDDFATLNGAHGDEVGDDVLAAVATLLRHTFRPTDLLARLAGDQFAAWLDGADELTAAERAEDLRGGIPAVAEKALPPGSEPLSASIGIAPAGRDGAECDELLHRGCRAVAMAKSSGKGGWRVLAAAVEA